MSLNVLPIAVLCNAVVESHPDNALSDLRLDDPFPALVDFCDNLDLESMSKKDHSHTPWLVLIYKHLQQWKASVRLQYWFALCNAVWWQSLSLQYLLVDLIFHLFLQHGGMLPKNYKEKNQFKDLLRAGTVTTVSSKGSKTCCSHLLWLIPVKIYVRELCSKLFLKNPEESSWCVMYLFARSAEKRGWRTRGWGELWWGHRQHQHCAHTVHGHCSSSVTSCLLAVLLYKLVCQSKIQHVPVWQWCFWMIVCVCVDTESHPSTIWWRTLQGCILRCKYAAHD